MSIFKRTNYYKFNIEIMVMCFKKTYLLTENQIVDVQKRGFMLNIIYYK